MSGVRRPSRRACRTPAGRWPSPFRDRLADRRTRTARADYVASPKFVYYLSAEYMLGRQLRQNAMYTGTADLARQAVSASGYSLEDLEALDIEPGLGNGGLGRLAACLLDSLEGEAIAGGLGYRVGGTEHLLPSPGYRHRGGHRHAGRDGNQQGRIVPLQRNASAPRRRTWRRTGPAAAAQRSAPFLPRPGVEPLVTGLRVADQQIRAAWDMFAAMGEVRRFAVTDVRIMELVTRDESAVPTLRWEATGPRRAGCSRPRTPRSR